LAIAFLALPRMTGGLVARELDTGEQIADFHFDKVEESGVVHEITFVQKDDDRGHTDLAREQMCSESAAWDPRKRQRPE